MPQPGATRRAISRSDAHVVGDALPVEHASAVDERDRGIHGCEKRRHLEVLLPARHEHDRVRISEGALEVGGQLDIQISELLRKSRHHWIVDRDPRSPRNESLHDGNRGGLSHIVGVGLERQAEYRDALGLKGVDGTLDVRTSFSGCSSFVSITARRTRIGCSRRSPSAIRARTSFGRQLPPKPHPGLEERGNRRADPKTVRRERTEVMREMYALHDLCDVDVPNSRRLPISLANEIIVASNAFDVYLIISAVRVSVRRRGTLVGKLL